MFCSFSLEEEPPPGILPPARFPLLPTPEDDPAPKLPRRERDREEEVAAAAMMSEAQLAPQVW